MAKFDGSRVDTLDFDLISPVDFRPKLPNGEVDYDHPAVKDGVWVGIVPEPSHDQLDAFNASMADLRLEAAEAEEACIKAMDGERRLKWRGEHPVAEGDTELSDDELDAKLNEEETTASTRHRMQRLLEARMKARHVQTQRTNDAVAELCSGHPGADVLACLPFRAVDGFIGWLMGNFSPEALAAAIKA